MKIGKEFNKTQEKQVRGFSFFHFFPILQTLERIFYSVIVPTINLYV